MRILEAGMILYVVGRPTNDSWELLGVFSTPEKAETRCTREGDFVGPVRLDESLPEATETWLGAYFYDPINGRREASQADLDESQSGNPTT